MQFLLLVADDNVVADLANGVLILDLGGEFVISLFITRLRLFCGDHFDLTPELLGERSKIDCVWDRGSLVAITPEEREK